MTLSELILSLTTLAKELPQGMDPVVKVWPNGLVFEYEGWYSKSLKTT